MSKSSKEKFKIASPDAPLIKKLHKLIGEHLYMPVSKKSFHNCISFQISTKRFRSKRNIDIIKLQTFYKYSDLLPIVFQTHLENYKTDQDLVPQFVKQKGEFQKTCMNKYDSYNFKRNLKMKQIDTSSSCPVETLCSTWRILSISIYYDNCYFAIKQMMQLISISVKLYHLINVLEKWHKS